MEKNKESQARDNLRAINGIGPKYAKALYRIGIVRYADLAQHTAVSLSQILTEETGQKISPERIENDDWLGQAARLAAKDSPGNTGTAATPETAAEPEGTNSATNWRQHAGFSLFFDYEVDANGRQSWQTRIWQTRVYHDESGDQVELSGIEPDSWVNWIVEKAQLPVPAPALMTGATVAELAEPAIAEPKEKLDDLAGAGLEILDVLVSEMGASEALPEKHLRAEVHFKLKGSTLSRLVGQTDSPSLHLQVQAVDLATGSTNHIESSDLPLKADVYEYVSELELPLPKIGNYELHHDLSLDLPVGVVTAHYEGPVLKVIP